VASFSSIKRGERPKPGDVSPQNAPQAAPNIELQVWTFFLIQL